MNIFLSYSTNDKKLAHTLKEGLEFYGVEAFLAHDDIKPTEEWQDRILEELNSSQVFIPLLTKDFLQSLWTDQETGIAIAKEQLIIPLKVTKDPHGFVSRYQALKLKADAKKTCSEIVHLIADKPSLGHDMRNLIIELFGESWSYANAAKNAEILDSFSGYTPAQLKKIMRYIVENSQIRESFDAKDILRPFLRTYQKSIPTELYEATSDKIRKN